MDAAYAVLFDLDGVLIDTGEHHRRAWHWLAERHDLDFSDDLFRETFGMPNERILPRMAGRELDEAELAELAEEKEARFREIIADELDWLPGARELLVALREAGDFRRGLFTSTPWSNLRFLDRILGLSEHLDVMLAGEDIPRGKPAPDGYALLAEHLDVPRAASVVIEDAIPGVEAAQAAGIRCIAVTTTRSADDLAAADWVVAGVHELDVERIRTWLDRPIAG